jgi:hypothetical protein
MDVELDVLPRDRCYISSVFQRRTVWPGIPYIKQDQTPLTNGAAAREVYKGMKTHACS